MTATVKLPEGIKGTKVWGYTGKRDAKGKDYKAELTGTGATIEATRPFRSKENLTVVLEWPPGLLEERAYEEARGSLFRDHPPAALGLVLLAGAFVYYLVAWIKVGKDPAKGIIIPLYGPPEGLSAAAVRYIDQMGHDNKCFSAGVVGLAAKGEATIEKDGKVYVLHPKMLTPAQKGELLELLNEGEVKELEALKGISMRRAEGIREARPYEQVEDVLRVKGIGKGALAKMINHMSGTGDSPGEPLAADETGLHKKLFGAGSLRLKQSNHARIGGALQGPQAAPCLPGGEGAFHQEPCLVGAGPPPLPAGRPRVSPGHRGHRSHGGDLPGPSGPTLPEPHIGCPREGGGALCSAAGQGCRRWGMVPAAVSPRDLGVLFCRV